MAGGSGVHDQRARITQTGRARKHLHAVHHFLATLVAALHLEADHGAKGLHLFRGDFVTGMLGQAGIVHALDFRVLVEKLRDLLRVRAVRRHAQVERADAAQDQPGVEGADDAAEVADHLMDQLVDNGLRADDGAPHGVAVAAQVLRCGVHHDRHAEAKRLLKGGAGEGVIDHGRNAARAPEGGQRRNVQDRQHRVRWRLKINHARIGLDGLLKVLYSCRFDEGGRSAHARQFPVEEIIGRPVERARGHHVVARLDVSQDRGRDRRHPGGESQGCFSSLELLNLLFERANRGVAVARVHVSEFLFPVDRGHLIRAGGDERGGLVDGCVERARHPARRLSGVDGQRRELMSVCHYSPLIFRPKRIAPPGRRGRASSGAVRPGHSRDCNCQ